MFRKSDHENSKLPPRGEFDPADPENEATAAITEIRSVSLYRSASPAREPGDTPPTQANFLRSGDDEALGPGYRLRNRFEIVALVHASAMSHVYKAIDTRRRLGGMEQNFVAIKMIRPSLDSKMDGRLALEREAANTQRLAHPNIVNIYDFDQHDDRFYLVMEWLEGESVNALLRRTSGRPVARQFAWRVIEGIVDGLEHAHSHNVVHADINPSNVFVTDTQEIKILDFGVARTGNRAAGEGEEDGIWATRGYASPEVLSGSPATFEDDVFSLACVAYRLLTGTHPFAGMSSIEAREANLTVEPVPGLPDSDWRTLRRALSFERHDRPRTPSVFLAGFSSASVGARAGAPRSRPSAERLPLLLVSAIILAAAAYWYWQMQPLQVPEDPVDTESPGEDRPVELPPVSARLEQLLLDAGQAIDEQRLLAPEGNNARDFYREALALDDSNSYALSGLRSISDIYVRKANAALLDNAPDEALAALADAAGTDPQNPSIAIVSELLVARGNSQLAGARLAAAEGNTEMAADLLSAAERFGHIDAAEIDEVRSRIAFIEVEQEFLDKMAIVEAHLAAGRLVAPDGANALAALTEIRRDHDGNARLSAVTQQLGDRLIARAAMESAKGNDAGAGDLLDAADALGVASIEVDTARETLRRRAELANEADIGAAGTAALPLPETTLPASAAELAGTARAGDARDVADAGTRPADTGITETAPERQLSLDDLAIEKYVAPQFPRRAQRRGQSGYVDVRFSILEDGRTANIEIVDAEPAAAFESSAETAVRQWRFAPREDVVRSRVTLRFELPQER